MARQEQLEQLTRILEGVTARYTGMVVGCEEPVRVASLDGRDHLSRDLVIGVFPFPRRAIGVEGRHLTTAITRQPSLAVTEGTSLKVIAYAEDVMGHSLRRRLVRKLRALGEGV